MKLLVTSDWHFRFDNPSCRTDNFFETQKSIINSIFDKAKETQFHIVIAGDIFHVARPQNAQILEKFLIEKFLNYPEISFIAGNHDLIYHNKQNMETCSIGVLQHFNNKLPNIDYFDFGDEIIEKNKIAVMHMYIHNDTISYVKNGIEYDTLLDKYNYNLIITGDNHQSFVKKHKNKLLINPGCISKQNIDMKNEKLYYYIVDTDSLEYERFEILDNAFIKEKHIPNIVDNDFSNVIQILNKEVNIDLDFKKNLENVFQMSNTKKEVIDIINRSFYDLSD